MNKTVCCLFGGKSTEYEVSLNSVYSVLQNIDRQKYNIVRVGITRDGGWFLYSGDDADIKNGSWCDQPEHITPAFFSPSRGDGNLYLLSGGAFTKIPVDVVFPVMHGAFGEDGTLQGFLEMNGIPFVGAGCASSAICMDKSFAKLILNNADIPMADALTVYREEIESDPDAVIAQAEELFPYPMFVKPSNAGSSVGVKKAKDAAMLKDALIHASEYDRKILIEEYIKGREIEVAVLGNEKPASLGCGEVIPGGEFYDYDDKYNNDTAKLNVPAEITEEQRLEVMALAERIYSMLDCRGLARVDFFLTDHGFVFNEINTLPGFTSISLYPRIAMNSGIGYSELIDRLLSLALDK